MPVAKSAFADFRLRVVLRLIRKLTLSALRPPPRLPAQPPIMPRYHRWLGGEAGRGVERAKKTQRGFWNRRKEFAPQPSALQPRDNILAAS